MPALPVKKEGEQLKRRQKQRRTAFVPLERIGSSPDARYALLIHFIFILCYYIPYSFFLLLHPFYDSHVDGHFFIPVRNDLNHTVLVSRPFFVFCNRDILKIGCARSDVQ